VRELYYARLAEQAKPGKDQDKLVECQRKAFGRAIKSLADAKLLVAVLHKGERFVWLS
jgi:hypothetical protein